MHYRPFALALCAAAVVGCGKSDDTSTRPGPADSGGDGGETPAGGASWYQDVRPIVYDACASCHNGGGIGPGDFTDYGAVYAARDLIQAYVAGGLMPLPVADPECRPYVGHERMNLTDVDRDLLVDWAAGDAAEGDEADAAPAEVYSGTLSGDLLEMPMPFEHTLQPDEGGSEYFCVTPESPFDAAQYITAFDIDLGNREVVHHACLFVDYRGNAGAGYGVSDPENGFDCSDPIVEDDWLPIHCWAPGMEPVEFPEGMGLEVSPQHQLVLQMHYFTDSAETQVDQSTYRFRTVDSVEREVFMDVAGPDDFLIPAGDDSYSASDTMRNYYGADVEILGAFPHMHLLGESFRAWVEDESGAEQCLVAGDYSFDHQMTYMLEEPLPFPQGSSVGFECTWNNSSSNPENPSDPPQDVVWGEGTTEEMCYLLFYVGEL